MSPATFLHIHQIRNATNIEELKQITLMLLEQNEMLKEMLKQEYKNSLGILELPNGEQN